MDISNLFLYLSWVTTAVVTVPLSSRMRKKYHEQFLSSLFYLVLYINLGNFFLLVWNRFLINVLDLKESAVNSIVYFILQNLFLLMPIFLLTVYFFIKLTVEMLGKIIPRRFKIYYVSISFLCLLVYFYHFFIYLDSKTLSSQQIFLHSFFWITVRMMLAVIPIFLILRKSHITKKRIQKGVKGFGLLYFSAMVIINISDFFNLNKLYIDLFNILFIIIPLCYLNYQLKYCQLENADLSEDSQDLRVFLKTHNITDREKEIIGLVAQGKSNLEIADKVFLSEQTIKQHIHNIYQKLGVKNRVQLSNFVRNSLKKQQKD